MQFCDDCGSMMKAHGERMVCTNDDCDASSERDRDREDEFVTTESQIFDDVIESDEGANFEGSRKRLTSSVTSVGPKKRGTRSSRRRRQTNRRRAFQVHRVWLPVA